MAEALTWSRRHDGYIASCGEESQGVASVQRYRQTDGTDQWTWSVDMLPHDAEPCIFGTAATTADAKAAAARQVTNWPQLIEGARRHG